ETFFGIELDASGRILAFALSVDENRAVSIDSATGATTVVGVWPGAVSIINNGENAIDRESGILYQIAQGPDPLDLLTIDLAGGDSTIALLRWELLSSVACPMCRGK